MRKACLRVKPIPTNAALKDGKEGKRELDRETKSACADMRMRARDHTDSKPREGRGDLLSALLLLFASTGQYLAQINRNSWNPHIKAGLEAEAPILPGVKSFSVLSKPVPFGFDSNSMSRKGAL